MKIFISWSGERSKALASALRDWFPLVLHYVEPWLSKADIQAGERWGIEIAKELEGCNFGVLCITKENMNAPWILFEAGALAKSMQDGRVIPLLLDLDVKDISGPLAQFQAQKVERDGIKELIAGLNKAATTPIPEGQLEKLFAALWNDLETHITAIPKNNTQTKHTRSQGEILEELVASVRSVEMRLRNGTEKHQWWSRRRQMKIPSMIARDIASGPDDPVQLLLLSSAFREEMPWLLELAAETYRSIKSGSSSDAREVRQRFLRVLDYLIHGPPLEFIGMESRLARNLLEEMMIVTSLIDSRKTSARSSRSTAISTFPESETKDEADKA